ncbi:MAG: hypothetical protein JWM20_239 [Patescibacteria group bacterium]|nr:hypothetical protein [Patescibacteria group bacterium]
MNHPETNLATGLTSEQAKSAPRNVSRIKNTGAGLIWSVARSQVLSFFFFLLIVSGALSFALHQNVDACIFIVIALLNSVIGFFQEYRATKSTEALEKLVTHMVTVRRDGKISEVPSTEVVLGDIIICEPGDVFVSDMVVRTATDAFVDNSVRTGETLPQEIKVGEQLFAGSSLVGGTVEAQVTAVGAESSLLKYAEKISSTEKSSNFERFLNHISRSILVFTVLCLSIVFVGNVLISHSMLFSQYILYAISILVSVVPELLPLIVTLILTREALALAKSNVLVKKLSVLENLGSMDFLFTDKTGTITQNNLSVHTVVDLDDVKTMMSRVANADYKRTPMDAVFDEASKRFLRTSEAPAHVTFSPFEVVRGYASYTFSDGTEIIRGQYPFVAGASVAPHSFLDTCKELESQGFRVIAYAKKMINDKMYILQGAAVFEDPLKEDVIDIYREIENSGVDIKILTGDSVPVAAYVGSVLDPGKDGAGSVYSMDAWTGKAPADIETYEIYARCKPDQKSELIDEYLGHGVIGFIGDGINDALALKRADVGFVVDNASDIARQSADVILLEKSLSPVLAAIKMSRDAFEHIRTYLLCTITGNIGTLISLTVVTLSLRELPMLPIQILLNNLLTDFPLIFLIADTVSSQTTKKPVRENAKRFFTIMIAFSILSSLFDFTFFYFFKSYDISVVRTGWFVFSVFAELTIVFSLRSELSIWKSPKLSNILGGVMLVCAIVAIALPFIPVVGAAFHLYALSGAQVGIIVGLMAIYLVANEILKFFLYKRKSLRE